MSILFSDPQCISAAEALRHARTTGTTIAPISVAYGIKGLDAAYAVAAINHQERSHAGARLVGMKIGLTSQAVQKQLGVSQPDFGVLFDDMEYLNGSSVPMNRLIQPKAEAEVAFIIGCDLLCEQPTWGEFINSVAYALPAIEVVDSAITDWRIALEDTVADNASCGVYVLGDQPVALGQIDLVNVAMQMSLNGSVVSIGSGAACLGHPLRAAFWLARTMVERGMALRAGQVILSGALVLMVSVTKGDYLNVTLGALGIVSCQIG